MVMGRACSGIIALASALSFVSIVPGAARAQDESANTPPEAIRMYAEGREHYAAGRYAEAADALERALVLDPDSPTLVYNLARVRELLGQIEAALELYGRYQRLLPQQQAEEQERADATIRRLQGARDSQRPEAPPPPPEEVAPLRQLPGIVLVRENGVADAAFWVTLAAGVAALAAGASFGALALVEQQFADSFVLDGFNNRGERDSALDRAQTYGYVTDISLGVGGVAVIAAGLLYFLRSHTVERAPIRPGGEERAVLDVVATPLLDGAALVIGGRL